MKMGGIIWSKELLVESWLCSRNQSKDSVAHLNRSAASGDAMGNISDSLRACVTVQLSIMVLAKGESVASMSSWLGRPVNSMILSS